MPEFAVGVDLGGTWIKLILVDEQGTVHLQKSIPTLRDDSSPAPVIGHMVGAARQFREESEAAGYPVKGVGVATPCYHEGPDWTLLQVNNLPSLEGFPLFPALSKELGTNLAIINDASAAGIAEHLFGKSKGCDRVLSIAIGTGISLSFITLEKGLVHFAWDTIGDSGQIIVDPEGVLPCPCGGRGCLEAYAAAPAIRQQAINEVQRGRSTVMAQIYQMKNDLEAKDVGEAANQGDPVAMEVLARAGHYLGVGMTSYLHIFAPRLILLSGGVSHAGRFILDPLQSTLYRLGNPWYLRRLGKIDLASLGENAGAIGAASLILYPGKYIH